MKSYPVHQYTFMVLPKQKSKGYLLSIRFNHVLAGNYYRDHTVAAKHIAQYCNEEKNKKAFNINKFNQYALFKYDSNFPDWEGTLDELVKLEYVRIEIET